jgi:hypothetical protein
MSSLYGMQRANGDWFAVKDNGRLRVPVFRSSREAMEARARNSGMMLFKPMGMDERALDDLAPTKSEGGACFWLVNNPEANLSHGHPLEHAQLAQLIRDSREQPTGMRM